MESESAALIHIIKIVVGLSKQQDFHWPENRLKKREKLITKEEKKIQNSKLMKRKFNRNRDRTTP